MMEYKGYTGVLEVDVENETLHGRVLGLRDVITFQGKSVEEARSAFQDSIEEYIKFCAERNEGPEKPYSGKFLVRIAPSVHRALAMRAELQKISLNSLVESLLQRGTAEERILVEQRRLAGKRPRRFSKPKQGKLTAPARARANKVPRELTKPKKVK